MDFGGSGERATELFFDAVGELIAENRKNIPVLWSSECKDTWEAALREFKPSHPVTCNHKQEPHDSNSGTSSRTQSSATKWAFTSNKIPRHSSSQRSSQLFGLLSKYDVSNTNVVSARKTPFSVYHGNSKPQTQSHCKKCPGDDPTVFPFVSDVAPLTILLFLEAVQNHKELSFFPMTLAYIPEQPKYLSNGISFRVTRVPWQQVRADTEGRIVSDAVYKRLNPEAPRKVWLDLMKDLVVTHHMTYHVSDFHKRNVVKLLGLGWERVIDDLGEPTLAPVIALEYAPYGTLHDLFYSSSFLSSYPRKLRLLSDVAEGLRALHFSSVIHGDVKPKNILVYNDHTHGIIAKLCDFGLSIIDPDCGPELQRLPGGTPMYLAPEAGTFIPKALLKYTDVYSFGIVAWQTLLGGNIPFFSPRFKDGEFLSEAAVRQLKTGRHDELAALYGLHTNSDQFSRVTEELQENEDYEPPVDPVNDLLLAMARDNLGHMTSSCSTDQMEATVPASELPTLLSVLQISLSSCPIHRRLDGILILLGKPYQQRQIMISEIKWEYKIELALQNHLRYQTVTARSRELFSSIFEQFFVSLQQNPKHRDVNALGRWDAVLARHLGSTLVEYYLWKVLGGDRTEKTRSLLLSYLALCSSAGDLNMCSAGSSVHQLLASDMKWSTLYTTGTALAMLKGDNSFWNIQHPVSSKFQEKLTKGLIQRFGQELVDVQHNRVAAHVLLKAEMGPFDVDVRNSNGDTLLNLACQSANFPLAFELVTNYGASASIANNHGEEPIHWLHQIPAEKADVIEAIAVILAQAGADVECYAPPRSGDYCHLFSNITLFPTPLLRAIARRNVPAVSCLVRLGAEVSAVVGSIYTDIEMSPLSLAASMLDHECLEVMFPYWPGNSDTNDINNTEANGLWEDAIGGLSARERIKLHGGQYATNVQRTLEVLTKYLGPCYIVRNAQASILYAVDGGDLVWVEALLQNLFSEPRKAVLADLQKALECATAQGYKHIVKKVMEYGALPLLPHTWSLQGYTTGRPGRWDEKLIDRLTQEMSEYGHICARTKCSLHFCACGGADSVEIAEEIMKSPVVNKSLIPSLPNANNHGLPHLVIGVIEGRYPKLDRPDEDHHTPLYDAIANGEFKLAQSFIARNASYKVDQWSLVAQIFEDGRASLPQQIKFLLDQKQGKPAFNVLRRIFGRVQPQRVSNLRPDVECPNWRFEEHTVITAMAQACTAFDSFNKEQCWLAVLGVFNDPEQILVKAGDGRDALEIAIDAADHDSLHMLVEQLRKNPKVFDDYTVIDRIRKLILAEPPPHVADSPMKETIISYRRDLGDMMRTMLDAGDRGRNDQSDLCERILEIITYEFPILAIGFSQRGSGHESTEQFKSDTEKFCNAFTTTLYCCRPRTAAARNTLVDSVETGMKLILSKYFEVQIQRWERVEQRGAKIILNFKQMRPLMHTPLAAAEDGKQPDKSTIQSLASTESTVSQARPLLNWDLYRKLIVTEMRVSSPGRQAIPNFAKVPAEYSTLSRLGLVNGTQISIPGADFFVSITLRISYPNRKIDLLPRSDKPDPGYHFNPSPSQGTATFRMQIQENKIKYFKHVIRQVNPRARNISEQQMAKMIRNHVLAHADNCVNTRAFSEMDEGDMHPLFGRVMMKDAQGQGYRDLPMETYIESGRKLEQDLLEHYKELGQELPDELKRILDLKEESSSEEE